MSNLRRGFLGVLAAAATFAPAHGSSTSVVGLGLGLGFGLLGGHGAYATGSKDSKDWWDSWDWKWGSNDSKDVDNSLDDSFLDNSLDDSFLDDWDLNPFDSSDDPDEKSLDSGFGLFDDDSVDLNPFNDPSSDEDGTASVDSASVDSFSASSDEVIDGEVTGSVDTGSVDSAGDSDSFGDWDFNPFDESSDTGDEKSLDSGFGLFDDDSVDLNPLNDSGDDRRKKRYLR